MSEQIIEAEYGLKLFYFKVPEGRDIENAYDYYVKWLKLHIQWEKDGKIEEIDYFNETEPEYKNPTKVNIYSKQELKDRYLMDWLFSSDDDDDDDDDDDVCDCCCKSWNNEKPNELGVCQCWCSDCVCDLKDCRYKCKK